MEVTGDRKEKGDWGGDRGRIIMIEKARYRRRNRVRRSGKGRASDILEYSMSIY